MAVGSLVAPPTPEELTIDVTIFEVLLMAHIAGDWLLQTEWQAQNKDRNWRAMLSHVLIYHAMVLGVLGAKLGFREPAVYTVVIALAVSHAVIDRSRSIAWITRTLRITVERASEKWLSIVTDQAIHLLLLGLAAFYLSSVVSQ